MATLLIAALIVPAGLKMAVLFHYVLDYNNYVTVLCENRDKPELKCNGQCHLAKELKEVDEPVNHSGAAPIPAQLQAELVFLLPPVHHHMPHALDVEVTWISSNDEMAPSRPAHVLVPPPEFMA